MVATGTDLRAPRRPVLGVLIFGLYLTGGLVAYWHIWAHPATWQPQSGVGDPTQYDWFLRWTPWAIAHGHNPFVTFTANVPFGANLVSNTAMFGLALAAAPVTLLWGPVASLNLLFTLSFPLSAGAMYILARRFVTWRPAAFAAGLLYGFSPYMVGQGSGHLNLVFVPLPPLIFLVLYELLVRQTGSARRWGVWLGLLIVVQFLISSEILATTALFSLIALAVLAVTVRSAVIPHLRWAWRGLAAAVIIPVVALAWPLYEMFFGAQLITARIAGYQIYHSSLAGPFFPTPLIEFATARMKSIGQRAGANNSENGTYLGLPLILLFGWAVIFVRKPVVRLAGLLAVVTYVLSLGVRLYIGIPRYDHLGKHIPLPALILYKLPLINQAFPVRYALFITLFVGIVLAVALQHLHERGWSARSVHSTRRWTVALPTLVALLALFPLVPAWPYPDQGNVHVPKFFTTSDVDRLAPGTVTLVYPYAMNTDISPLLWQAETSFRFRMLGGYFLVPAPGGWQFYTPTTVEATLTDLRTGPAPVRTAALRSQLIDELREWKVRAIVAQPIGADPVGFFTWLTGRRPDAAVGGMVEWYNTTWG